MEEHKNLTISQRDIIIDGTVMVFVQEYYEFDYDFSVACIHLDKGQTAMFASEGIEIYTGDDSNDVGFADNNSTKINLRIIKRWE